MAACTVAVFLSWIGFAWSAAFLPPVLAQSGPEATPNPNGNETPLPAPNQVNIKPTARDEEIRSRLQNILEATGWFQKPEVKVQEGVVFLNGQTETSEYKQWAGDLARNTQDVVAVVNKINLTQPPIWDFRPALSGLQDFWLNLKRSLPVFLFSLLVLLVTWMLTRLIIAAARASLKRRLSNPLLTNVASYALGVAVFLIGLYLVLRVAGLTGIAITVLGGTGLFGLVLGIAFRDITENFLASIFLSIQNPFRTGDLVEIVSICGFVQALTTRSTVLMTLDGNQVQIPNATVYKSNIYNYTSNPNRRVDFMIGIGYTDPVVNAQETALKVLKEHPAVLEEPEPWVLVDSLGNSTVNLCIYFWLDSSQHSWLKVKSSVMRLVKRAFQNAGISMPDEAREIVFPEGVPIWQKKPPRETQASATISGQAKLVETPEPASISTNAEAGLQSEAGKIQEQARRAWKPEDGENLLKSSDQGDSNR
jgi:small-conductance mechanosensitive channel